MEHTADRDTGCDTEPLFETASLMAIRTADSENSVDTDCDTEPLFETANKMAIRTADSENRVDTGCDTEPLFETANKMTIRTADSENKVDTGCDTEPPIETANKMAIRTADSENRVDTGCDTEPLFETANKMTIRTADSENKVDTGCDTEPPIETASLMAIRTADSENRVDTGCDTDRDTGRFVPLPIWHRLELKVYKITKDCLVIGFIFPTLTRHNLNRPNIINPLKAKYRTDMLYVIDIVNLKTGLKQTSTESLYPNNKKITYNVNSFTCDSKFDDVLENECSTGIHFFIDEKTAIDFFVFIEILNLRLLPPPNFETFYSNGSTSSRFVYSSFTSKTSQKSHTYISRQFFSKKKGNDFLFENLVFINDKYIYPSITNISDKVISTKNPNLLHSFLCAHFSENDVDYTQLINIAYQCSIPV
jgi:RNase P/RNase MRP subunit p29